MHCCRIVNGIKNKNIKNSLGAKWNASHLAVRLCVLRHWKRVSMPPTTQSLRHPLTRAFHVAPRIKTARRFTAKNPWWQNDFLEGGRIKFPKRFCMVGTRYFESTEKVQFFKDQNEKCLRFITFLSTNRLNKAMIGRKRRVKRLFLRY